MELFELFGALHGRLGVVAEAGINHQIGPNSDALSRLSHQGQICSLVFSQWSPAKLNRCEAPPNEASASLTGLFRSISEQVTGVRANLGMKSPSQQPPNGKLQSFALEIGRAHV